MSSVAFLRARTWAELFRSIGVVMVGAMLACALNVFEFLLLVKTSGLTLSIVGIVKVGGGGVCLHLFVQHPPPPPPPLFPYICMEGLMHRSLFRVNTTQEHPVDLQMQRAR